MSNITTTSQPVIASPLKRLISAHPLVSYFVIAFAGTWAFLLPFALSRNVNGLGLVPFTPPDIALLIAFLFAAPAGPALASLSVTAITSGKAESTCTNCRNFAGKFTALLLHCFVIR